MTENRPPSLPGDLLAALARTGPQPALAWYGEDGRTELSGRVLANWLIKTVNHLSGEVGLAAGDELVLDLPPHWKRLVLALAAWSLGATVRIPDGRPGATGDDGDSPSLVAVASDAPDGPLARGADELLVLEAVSLSLRAPGALPPLARDWAQEVRGSDDALSVPVGPWSGPAPADPPADPGRPVEVGTDGAAGDDAARRMLRAWRDGARIIGPSGALDDAAREAEQLKRR